jgi:hypothetical protein
MAALAGLLFSPEPARASCASDCDANYYLCLRGGASIGERGCSTARSICTMRCGPVQPIFRAIAVSPATSVYGFSGTHSSQGAAEHDALARCRAHGGQSDCKVGVWFKNGWCGALAQGPGGAYGTAQSSSARAAEGNATECCRQHSTAPCSIKVSICAR